MPETKQIAMNLFEMTRKEFLDYARWIAKDICRKKGHVTSDDVREFAKLPPNIDGRVYGAIFSGDEWIKTGYTQTKIKSSHGRPIAVFTLTGGALA